jgi:hypothetical protein
LQGKIRGCAGQIARSLFWWWNFLVGLAIRVNSRKILQQFLFQNRAFQVVTVRWAQVGIRQWVPVPIPVTIGGSVNRRCSALLSLFLIVLVAKQVAAQDPNVCANLFGQGYYDFYQTFSDQRSFKYVQSIICSDTTLTKQQAAERSLGSGGNYLDVITGYENYGDSQKSFEEQRARYCSMTFDAATASDSRIQTTRKISLAATDVMKHCFDSQGFHAAIVPSRNLASFAIFMTYNGYGVTDIKIDKISANPKITCDTDNGTTVHSGANVICSKDADTTVQVAMNTDKGPLHAIDVLGTNDINNDIQNQLKILTDKVAAIKPPSCLGCIEQSVLTENQFQQVNGTDWVLCDGHGIGGTKLAQTLPDVKTVPDLRGVFLRGKASGRFSDTVEQVDLGALELDTVGPHTHTTRNLDDAPQNKLGQGIFWDGGKRYSDGPSVFVLNNTGSPETRPKNVTVNFFCKVN